MPKWRFPSNDYGEIKGINDSGITTFKGTPISSLAREICQNSLDASKNGCAEVEFSLFSISQNNIPGWEQLKKAFRNCYEYWSKQKNNDCCEFFSNAINKSEDNKCIVLRISDHLTSGLTGSRELINTNWTNLIKSSGVSDKKGASGGSFGIGKFATFACSDYASVFYSTYDINEECAYQGVARLVTFEQDDTTTQGIGFYGEERNTPVYEQLSLDVNYRRKTGDHGTDIYILAFNKANEDWKTEIIVAILRNFLVAIWEGMLKVKIDDITIDMSTLNKLIYEMYPDEMAKVKVNCFYEVLESNKTIWIENKDFYGLGEIKLGVLLQGQDLPRKISMIRKNGMKIMDKSYRVQAPYVGICLLKGDKLNARLRKMENPEHTKWEYKRLTDYKRGKHLLTSLDQFLSHEIIRLLTVGLDSAVDAVGVGNYIPDEPDMDSANGQQEGIGDSIADIEKQVAKTLDAEPSIMDGRNEIELRTESGNFDDGFLNSKHIVENPNTDNRKKVNIKVGGSEIGRKAKAVQLKKLRAMCIDPKNGVYVFVLSSSKNIENCFIEVNMSAENEEYPANIKEALIIRGEQLNINGNMIEKVRLPEDKEVRLKVVLDYNDYCPLGVNCYEIEE